MSPGWGRRGLERFAILCAEGERLCQKDPRRAVGRAGDLAEAPIAASLVKARRLECGRSPDYLERFGLPDFAGGCPGHRVIALPDEFCDLPQMRWLADLAIKARVVLKTSSYDNRFRSLLAGDGMAYLPRFHADGEAGLKRIDETPTPAPVVDLWLAVHKDNRNTRRIRAVIKAIASAASKRIAK